jgi:hypothetical protein
VGPPSLFPALFYVPDGPKKSIRTSCKVFTGKAWKNSSGTFSLERRTKRGIKTGNLAQHEYFVILTPLFGNVKGAQAKIVVYYPRNE